MVDSSTPSCAMGGTRTPAAASCAMHMPHPHRPLRLHDALQRDVPHAQLVTERTPPYNIIHANAAWQRILGRGADELVGKPFEALLSPHDQSVHHLLRRAFASGQQVTSLVTLKKRSGEWFQSPLTASPLLDSAGKELNWFVHVLHSSPSYPTGMVGAEGSLSSLDAKLAPSCSSHEWREMSDALSGTAQGSAARIMPHSAMPANGLAVPLAGAPARNGAHIGLSALSELHGGEPSLTIGTANGMVSLQEKFNALSEAKRLHAHDVASHFSSVGRGTADGETGIITGTSSPSDEGKFDEASANGPGSDGKRRNGYNPQRGGSALSSELVSERWQRMAAQPTPQAHFSGTSTLGIAQTTEPQPPAATSARSSESIASALKVRLLTHPEAKGLNESSSVSSSSSSLMGTLNMASSTTTASNGDRSAETSSVNCAGKSDEGSNGSEGRGSTSPAHESADTLLRAAAHAAAAHEQGKDSAASANGGSSSRSGGTNRVAPFLTKLFTIVDDPQLNEYATWCTNGSALRIVNPQHFADHCLPRFFKHNKLGSFQQQLLTYGFMRIPNDSCLDRSSVWAHPQFRQHAQADLEKIVRATSSGTKRGAQKQDPLGDEDALAERELAKMQKHLARLTQSVHGLHEELRTVRQVEMRALDQLVERVQKRVRPNGSDMSDSAASNSTTSTERFEERSSGSISSNCMELAGAKSANSNDGSEASCGNVDAENGSNTDGAATENDESRSP